MNFVVIDTKIKKDDWLDYVEQDVLCTALGSAKLCKAMKKITGLSVEDSLSAPCLERKYFISMRDESDEPIYTYNDQYMRHIVRQSFKERRVCSLNQYCRLITSNKVFKFFSRKLQV